MARLLLKFSIDKESGLPENLNYFEKKGD